MNASLDFCSWANARRLARLCIRRAFGASLIDDEVEDIAQETCIKLFQKHGQLNEETIRLVKICSIRRTIEYLRQRKNHSEDSNTLPSTVWQMHQTEELLDSEKRCVHAVFEGEDGPVLVALMDGLILEEIASARSESLAKVFRRKDRARQAILNCFRDNTVFEEKLP